MRLTGRKRPTLTTVAATVVLIAASALAARSGPADPLAGAVSLESGAGSSAVIDRAVHVPAVTVREAQVRHPKGTPKLPPSAIAHLDIPAVAMLAYQRAAAVMDQVDASCRLSWTLLAAIGRVESDHGRYGGAQLLTDGTSVPEIRGPALDGKGPFAMIRDTDAGRLDGDPVWDRAVGPMQFLPSTWAVVGVDADSDGVRSPNDINDAALATAVFLCSAPGSLDTRSGLRAAVYRYNPSSAYVASVLAVERAYRLGDFTMPGGLLQSSPITTILSTRSSAPTPGGQGGSDQQGQSKAQHQTRVGHQTTGPTTDPSHGSTGSSSPDPTDPPAPGTPSSDPTDPTTPDPTDPPAPTTQTPTPTPDPTPDPPPTPDPTPDPPPSPDPTPVELSGVLAACGADLASWCLGDQVLDVGDADFLAAPALADFDADGAVESNTDELTGLAGSTVTVLAGPDTAPAVVLTINGTSYRP